MIIVERLISRTETVLGAAACVPVLGTIPATAKIAMGILQTACALYVSPPAIIHALITKRTTVLNHCETHIKHGLGNIIAGALEAVPFIGMLIVLLRALKARGFSLDSQELKWLSYPSLQDTLQVQKSTVEVKPSVNIKPSRPRRPFVIIEEPPREQRIDERTAFENGCSGEELISSPLRKASTAQQPAGARYPIEYSII
jgi:hypothetical protein